MEEFVDGVSTYSDTIDSLLIPFHIGGSQGEYYLSIYYETGTNIIHYDKETKNISVRNFDIYENGERYSRFGTALGYTFARDTIAFIYQDYGGAFYYPVKQDTMIYAGYIDYDSFSWWLTAAEYKGRWFFGSESGDISYTDNLGDIEAYVYSKEAVGTGFVSRIKPLGDKIFAITYDSDNDTSYLYSSSDNGETWHYESESTSEFMDIFLYEGSYYWVSKTGFVFKGSATSVEEYPRPEIEIRALGEMLEVTSDRAIGEYIIIDMGGRVVAQGSQSAMDVAIDISRLPAGAYILDLGYASGRFVK
jgi:hypothetical protein